MLGQLKLLGIQPREALLEAHQKIHRLDLVTFYTDFLLKGDL
jgi:hypothetical protein